VEVDDEVEGAGAVDVLRVLGDGDDVRVARVGGPRLDVVDAGSLATGEVERQHRSGRYDRRVEVESPELDVLVQIVLEARRQGHGDRARTRDIRDDERPVRLRAGARVIPLAKVRVQVERRDGGAGQQEHRNKGGSE